MASLTDALRHGEAVHTHGYPWRVKGGVPEVGTPAFDPYGLPVRTEAGELCLDWQAAPMDVVRTVWPAEGWEVLK